MHFCNRFIHSRKTAFKLPAGFPPEQPEYKQEVQMEFQRDIHQLSFDGAKKEKSEGAKSGE
jgi:hypothetical protein